MLNIEYNKSTHKEDAECIIVNGIPDYESICYRRHRSVTIKNKEVLSLLTSHAIAELANHFSDISFDLHLEWWKFPINIGIFVEDEKLRPKYVFFNVELQNSPGLWSEGWSMQDFDVALIKITEKISHLEYSYLSDDLDYGFLFGFLEPQVNIPVDSLIKYYMEITEQIVNEAAQYVSLNDDKAIISLFDFPLSIRTPCQQYLMYFSQFLKDLGIDAETEIKENQNSTLFKIIPKNKSEALDKIKEALDIYINAPSISDIQFQNSNNGDISFIQMQANIMHLKSQILFSNTVIQLKDATIEALQLSNYQLKDLVKYSEDLTKQEEEIIPGISVKKYDGKGFSIDLPSFLRQLKRVLNK